MRAKETRKNLKLVALRGLANGIVVPLLGAASLLTLADPIEFSFEDAERQSEAIEAIYQRARSAHDQGDYAGALSILDASDSIVPRGPATEALRVSANLRMGNRSAGLAGWEGIAASSALPEEAARLIAEAFDEVDEPTNEMTVLRRGLLDSPRSVYLLRRLGVLEADSGRHSRALKFLEAAAKVSEPSSVTNLELDALARSYLATQQYVNAYHVYETHQHVGGDLEGLSKVHALLYRGEQEAALEQLDRTDYPDGTEILFRARVLLASGEPSRALIELDGATNGEMLPPAGHATRLLALLAASENEAAAQSLKQMIRDAVLEDPVPAAMVEMAQGNEEAAVSWLRKAPLPLSELATEDNVVESLTHVDDVPHIARIYFSYRLGFHSLVREEAEQSTSPLIRLMAADAARSQGDFVEAASAWGSLAELMPGAVSLKYQRALILAEMGKDEDARLLLADIVEERPDYIAASLSLANEQSKLEQWDAAIATLNFSLNFQPDSASLLIRLADYQLEAGNKAAAVETVTLLHAAPQAPAVETLQLMGRVEFAGGDLEAAQKLLERAVSLELESPGLLKQLAAVYSDLGFDRRAQSAEELADLLGS